MKKQEQCAEVGSSHLPALLKLHIYPGLTFRKDDREINVHGLGEGQVYYGVYDDYAAECPHRCTALRRMGEAEFINAAHRALKEGAATFSRVEF